MLRYLFCALLLLIFSIGCAKEVSEVSEPLPPLAKPSASASLPATRVETPTSGKGPLGRLGLMSEAPAGMCWLNMAEAGPESTLAKLLSPNPTDTSLQALAIAVNCQQLQAWRADQGKPLSGYLIIAQKMDERVGGGGGNQAKERWAMVQGLGGNYGFFPQDQYTQRAYLSGEADKLPANGHKQLGEVRRDDMALYTVGLGRQGEGQPQLLLTQYSQLRGTPVALLWHKPLAQVQELPKEIMAASAYLAGLVRQSDDPRTTGQASPPSQSQESGQTPSQPQQPAGQPGQTSAAPPASGPVQSAADIKGWQKALFGITPAQLRASYTLANPLREDLHGKAFYLDGSMESIGGLEFKVLFDFSDNLIGSQRLGRIILSNTTTGANPAEQKTAILADLDRRFGPPSSDASANGGPIIWDRSSGKASLQMMTSSTSTVWLVVLEAKK